VPLQGVPVVELPKRLTGRSKDEGHGLAQVTSAIFAGAAAVSKRPFREVTVLKPG